MPTRNAQLAELLSLTAQSISQLSEALTTFSFELMASEDPAARIASRRMVSRVSTIQSTFDQKWRELSAVAGIAPNTSGSEPGVVTHSSPENPGSAKSTRSES
ncbi:hypothetical protein NAV33_18405 [Pseudomonas stutzeri]|uniref:hypothetical protein n=1 Tax=Stutzerimonas stutzeri TaxID=316 RepID=UPI00210CFED8|nr:hypothetical protein [Stutzerimonas stutzeri]MCQ4313845.1 hypothetical protein [Stutzerimonas stutzeri]